jgi:hypothetical protein
MRDKRIFFMILGLGIILVMGVVSFLIIKANHSAPVSETAQGTGTESPWFPAIIILIVLTVTGLSLLPLLRIMFPPAIKNGVAAKAVVLKVWDTGVTINNSPRVGLLLEVKPEGGEPFQVEARKLISRLNATMVQPGATAEVIYDPANPKHVNVVTIQVEPAGPGRVSAEARLLELKHLREQDLITEEEYQAKKAQILKEV